MSTSSNLSIGFGFSVPVYDRGAVYLCVNARHVTKRMTMLLGMSLGTVRIA